MCTYSLMCAYFAQLGKMHPALESQGDGARRDFAKQYVSMIVHLAAWKPKVDDDGKPNAAAMLFDEYQVPHDAKPPAWLKRLRLECEDNADEIVSASIHRNTMREVRRVHPEKAEKTSSALHFVLASYEYRFLDACIEYSLTQTMKPADDQLDGFLWYLFSFPQGKSRAAVFEDMSEFARNKTGMRRGTIREKIIPLPENLPAVKTRRLLINAHQDTGDAGKEQVMANWDRHFTSLQGTKRAVVIELVFFEDSDMIDEVNVISYFSGVRKTGPAVPCIP